MDSLVLKQKQIEGHVGFGQAQVTVISENQALCATNGPRKAQEDTRMSVRQRNDGHIRTTSSRRTSLRRTSLRRTFTITTIGRSLEKGEHGSRIHSSADDNMIQIAQGRSSGRRVYNLTQEYQLTVLVGDLLIKLNLSMLIPATTAITKHSTQSSSTLS
jgi:hypothetical protein